MAFIDILAPPYNPKEGRDCNYYEKLVSDFFCRSYVYNNTPELVGRLA